MTRLASWFAALMILSGFWIPADASCNKKGNYVKSLSFGNVVVQRDIPIGSTIATAFTGAYHGGNAMAGCTTPWKYRWEMVLWSTLDNTGANVYHTNIPGVGIRLTNTAANRVLPYDQNNNGAVYVVINGDGIKGELIKTGDISGGILTLGTLARAFVVNHFHFAEVKLSGDNTVTSVACSVVIPTVNVPLGQHDKDEFSGIGSGTAWQDVNIMLNCDKNARINVRIDAQADDSMLPGVLKIDSSSEEANVSGVGVQLYFRDNNQPVRFGTTSFYYQSPYGGQETIRLKARYCQTKEKIVAGKANGTATFTLTYK